MSELLSILGDVVRILTFQPNLRPGFQPREGYKKRITVIDARRQASW